MHQFDKVEMFSFVEPEDAVDEHERLLAIEEELLQALGIPYRVVNIAVDDLGASAVKKYDCEAWLPGQGRYREVTSTSNTTDFQARRLDIRYRPADGGPRHVATLNGTAVTVAPPDRDARERPARGRLDRDARGAARVGCARGAAGRSARMSETITPEDPDIPDDPPPAGGLDARGRPTSRWGRRGPRRGRRAAARRARAGAAGLRVSAAAPPARSGRGWMLDSFALTIYR